MARGRPAGPRSCRPRRRARRRSPDPETLARARRLFARALETPGGLKIQTIHAFCEALLRRFPLEAGRLAALRGGGRAPRRRSAGGRARGDGRGRPATRSTARRSCSTRAASTRWRRPCWPAATSFARRRRGRIAAHFGQDAGTTDAEIAAAALDPARLADARGAPNGAAWQRRQPTKGRSARSCRSTPRSGAPIRSARSSG